MKYIGAHVSIEGGIFNAPLRAKDIGAKAMAFFTKNQKRWEANPYTPLDIAKFKKNLQTSKILASQILAHSSYLINLGHPDKKLREKSLAAFIDEIKRCEHLGVTKLNFHPGSHLRLVTEITCLNYIATSINKAIQATKNVTLVIENTAGQGSNLGYKFEHLAHLISNTTNKNRVGVCIDICHLFTAGYDFRTPKKYKETWSQFDKIIGFDYLKGVHLNDCKSDLGSSIDRHASIGKGKIGLNPFKFLMQDHRFDDIPLILETSDPTIWAEEIKLLYSLE